MPEMIRNRAEQAIGKKAVFGSDVDLNDYRIVGTQDEALDLDSLSREERNKIAGSGVDLEEKNRAGTLFYVEDE